MTVAELLAGLGIHDAERIDDLDNYEVVIDIGVQGMHKVAELCNVEYNHGLSQVKLTS